MVDPRRLVRAAIAQERLAYRCELPRREANQLHFVLNNGAELAGFARWAAAQAYYLCTVVASDERALEDQTFKLYYVISPPNGALFLILEYGLPRDTRTYPSLGTAFPAAAQFEEEIYDLFGLVPEATTIRGRLLLHAPYPLGLAPLGAGPPAVPALSPETGPAPGAGEWLLPVGPIHAGVIEAGQFRFHIDGEVINDLTLRLGYKHRGIEWLFQTRHTLSNGWQLAEKVSGDSSFAHALAYCRAVEALAAIAVPPAAEYWRALFLELERVCNHINDVAALVHDMAYDRAAAPLLVLRERAVRLCGQVTGSRLLRGVTRPGGVVLAPAPDLAALGTAIEEIIGEFVPRAYQVLAFPPCRERAIAIGVLTEDEARCCGVTGLVARASGLTHRDFRRSHAWGAYQAPQVQAFLAAGAANAGAALPPADLVGDVYARMRVRVLEVMNARDILAYLIKRLAALPPGAPLAVPWPASLPSQLNYDFALGYAEGWRGDVLYWLMKGPGDSIFRCKVRDPSFLNWPAVPVAVRRKPEAAGSRLPPPAGYWENTLADFPLINKSFNLSYAGHDG